MFALNANKKTLEREKSKMYLSNAGDKIEC